MRDKENLSPANENILLYAKNIFSPIIFNKNNCEEKNIS